MWSGSSTGEKILNNEKKLKDDKTRITVFVHFLLAFYVYCSKIAANLNHFWAKIGLNFESGIWPQETFCPQNVIPARMFKKMTPKWALCPDANALLIGFCVAGGPCLAQTQRAAPPLHRQRLRWLLPGPHHRLWKGKQAHCCFPPRWTINPAADSTSPSWNQNLLI